MRVGATIYHCKRTSEADSEIETFARPVKHTLRPNYLTIQPNSGSIYENVFGEYKDYSQKVCAIPYDNWENEIKEGDRFYLEVTPKNLGGEEPDEGWGYDADYKVVRVAKQNRAIYYALKSIIETRNGD